MYIYPKREIERFIKRIILETGTNDMKVLIPKLIKEYPWRDRRVGPWKAFKREIKKQIQQDNGGVLKANCRQMELFKEEKPI